MPGSSDFLQWNPAANNQENDAAYSADTLRANGIPSGVGGSGVLAPSLTHNKLYYQLSTMVAALAQFGANQGQTMSDANLTNLVTALEAFLATLNSPQFTGVPTAPTVGTPTDSTLKLANTAFVQAAIAAYAAASQKVFKSFDNLSHTLNAATGLMSAVNIPAGIINEVNSSGSVIKVRAWGTTVGAAGAGNPSVGLLIGGVISPNLLGLSVPSGAPDVVDWEITAELLCINPSAQLVTARGEWYNETTGANGWLLHRPSPATPNLHSNGTQIATYVVTSAAGVVVNGNGLEVTVLE